MRLRRPKFVSLSQKFSLLIFFGSAFVIITSTVLSFNTYKNTLQNSISERQLELTHQTMDQIDRAMYKAQSEIQSLSGDYIIESYLRTKVSNEKKSNNIQRSDVERRITDLGLLTGPWDRLDLVTIEGTVVASDDMLGEERPINSDELDLYRAALSGKPAYSDVYRDAELNRLTLNFVSPVYDSQKNDRPIIGVVYGHFAWPAILEMLELSKEDTITLFNNNGNIIGSSNPGFLNDYTVEDKETVVPTVVRLQGDSGAKVYKKNNNTDVLTTHFRESGYQSFKGNNWLLVIETPTNVVFAPAVKNAWQQVYVSTPIAVILVIILYLVLTHIVISPITKLTKATQNFSTGGIVENVIVNANDEIGLLARAFNEMTERLQKTYRTLWEEQAKLKASIQGLPNGFLLVSPQGEILFTSDAALSIFEITETPATVSKLQEMIGEDFDLLSNYDEMIRAKQPQFLDEVLFKEKYLKVYFTPVYARDTDTEKVSVVGGIVLIDDITNARILEKSRDDFFSIASHELRTPLTVIKGNTAMIKEYYDKLDDSEKKSMMDDIYASSVRLIAIVNDFLMTSRLEQKRLTFQISKVDSVKLILSSMKEVQHLANEKGLYLHLDSNASQQVFVNTDEVRLKEVLINLIADAIKFTSKGGVTVSIIPEDKYLKIRVSDTGLGIPEENRKFLFKKFQQATNNTLTRDPSRSTGLGLYISKLIIEGVGGYIYLESSEVGKGSVFAVKLPV